MVTYSSFASDRQLDFGLACAAFQEHGAVDVNFGMHDSLRETSMLCRVRSDFNLRLAKPSPKGTIRALR
jgi:hypothetical protein